MGRGLCVIDNRDVVGRDVEQGFVGREGWVAAVHEENGECRGDKRVVVFWSRGEQG